MTRMMVLCSLPRTNPGNRKEYKRVNGPYRLNRRIRNCTYGGVGGMPDSLG